MPRPGFKTITISEETWELVSKYYAIHKKELRREGVTTMAGLVEKHLNEILSEDDQPKDRGYRSDDA